MSSETKLEVGSGGGEEEFFSSEEGVKQTEEGDVQPPVPEVKAQEDQDPDTSPPPEEPKEEVDGKVEDEPTKSAESEPPVPEPEEGGIAGEEKVVESAEAETSGGEAEDVNSRESVESDSKIGGHKLDVEKVRLMLSRCLSMVAKGPASQTALLKETDTVGLLLLCLYEDSPDIVLSVLEVFERLMQQRNNIPTLRDLPYFVEALVKLAKRRKSNPEIASDALRLYKKLKETRPPLGEQSNTSHNIGNGHGNTTLMRPKKTGTANRSKSHNSKETILFIDHGVLKQKYVQKRIAEALIVAPGIISVTYSLNKNRCIIRGKSQVPSLTFGSTVANLGYEVSLVCKNENKEEVLVKVSGDKDESASKENFPDYLPEDDEEVPVSDDAVATCEAPQNQNESSSWFSTARNFVSSSFYW